MQTVAFISGKGGTGRITLVANTAALLSLAGCRCTVLDLDPQNALGTHFGMSPGELCTHGAEARSGAIVRTAARRACKCLSVAKICQ